MQKGSTRENNKREQQERVKRRKAVIEMAHRYGEPVLVTLDAGREPAAFRWRGVTYAVTEVLARWHLRDRWWVAAGEQRPTPTMGQPFGQVAWRPSDRRYFRVRCADEQVFELYHDAVSDGWVLDRALD